MPDRSSGFTPKTVPVTARVAPALIAQIESAARSLNIPRHRVLKASIQYGFSLAVAALTAQANAGQPA